MIALDADRERVGDFHLRLAPATRAAVAAAANRADVSMSEWVRERIHDGLESEMAPLTESGIDTRDATCTEAPDTSAKQLRGATRPARCEGYEVAQRMASTLPIDERGPLAVWPLRIAQADIDLIKSLAKTEGLNPSEWARLAFAGRMFGAGDPERLRLDAGPAPANVAGRLGLGADRLDAVLSRHDAVIDRLEFLAEVLGAPE